MAQKVSFLIAALILLFIGLFLMVAKLDLLSGFYPWTANWFRIPTGSFPLLLLGLVLVVGSAIMLLWHIGWDLERDPEFLLHLTTLIVFFFCGCYAIYGLFVKGA